ncbi:MAG: VIT domain-containing protein, partial [bacterium]
MNNAHNDETPKTNDDTNTPEPVRGDRLDELLRTWHDENATAARAMRDRVLERVERDTAAATKLGISAANRPTPTRTHDRDRGVIARIGLSRFAQIAALLLLTVLLATLFVKNTEKSAFADGGIAQVPEGGALDALDEDGMTIGPCPLQKTDVAVEISGPFARTVVEQTYANPYTRTIEAVYTFPLSERAAVDRMTMIVRGPAGERTIEGEVKERSAARAIYEEARESGYVASLLEQERPNIFTQSVANIEPGATV